VEGPPAAGHARQLAEHFAADDAAVGSGLLDHPWRRKRRRDVGRPADHARLARNLRHVTRAVDTILQRQDRGLVAEHRANQWQGCRIVVRLHGHDDDIDRPHRRGVSFGRRMHREPAERRTPNLQPAGTDGREVGATCDERDVVPRARQPGAVVPADRARPQDGKLHRYPPRCGTSPCAPLKRRL